MRRFLGGRSGPLEGVLETSKDPLGGLWKPFGGLRRVSWRPPGDLWESLGGILEASWAFFRPRWCPEVPKMVPRHPQDCSKRPQENSRGCQERPKRPYPRYGSSYCSEQVAVFAGSQPVPVAQTAQAAQTLPGSRRRLTRSHIFWGDLSCRNLWQTAAKQSTLPQH